MTEDSSQKCWYLLTSKPNQDQKAQEQLENQGYRVYRPLIVRNRKRRGKLVTVSESLFPRYMFIYLNTSSDNWAPIKSTVGVSGIVRFGQAPAKVPSNLIHKLQASAEQFPDGVVDLDCFSSGDQVILNKGAFSEVRGMFKSHIGEHRVIVLLNILNQEAEVTLPLGDVRKVQ